MKKNVFSRSPIDPGIFAGIKAPLLILDSLWQEQFRNQKTEKIVALEAKIKEIMKEHARLMETEKNLLSKKKECLSQIRNLAKNVHEYNDKNSAKATEMYKTAVLDINDELESMGTKADILSEKLENANRELLAETVSIIYFRMRESQSRLNTLSPEIERLRGEVKRLTAELIECEEEAARTYQLLHNLVGREVVNILDQHYNN